MVCREFLLVIKDIYRVNPLKPSKESMSIIDDAVERLEMYYGKVLRENFSRDDALHFGLSDDFRFGVVAGLFLSDRILAQDVGVINLVLRYREALRGGLSADTVREIVGLLGSFISGLMSIRGFVENCQVVYIPHRSIWHYFSDRFGKAYRGIVDSPEYGLLKAVLSRSGSGYVPPYMLDGFIASFVLSTSPYSDDRRVIVNLNSLSNLSKALSERLKTDPKLLTIYLHQMRAYSNELDLLRRLNITNNLDLVTPEVIEKLKKKHDPRKLREALEKLDKEKINEVVDRLVRRVKDEGLGKQLFSVVWGAIGLTGAAVFTGQPLEIIGELISAIGFGQGVIEFLNSLRGLAEDLYIRIFQKHFKTVTNAHADLLNLLDIYKP